MRRTFGVGLLLSALMAAALVPSGGAAAANRYTDLVAVTGTDSALWVRYSDQQTWRSLGGHLVDAPAIASVNGLFVGLGADRNVWVRTWDRPWKPLGRAGTRCSGPSAVVSQGVLGVACIGDDGAMWRATATVPADGSLPRLGAWRSLGGQFLYRAAVVRANSAGDVAGFAYSGVGRDQRPWERLEPGSTAWGRQAPVNGSCSGPSATSADAGGFACRDGASEGLRIRPVFEGEVVLPGRVVGRPAIGTTGNGERYYVLGVDGAIWVAVREPGASTARFVPFGGSGLYGVSAFSGRPA